MSKLDVVIRPLSFFLRHSRVLSLSLRAVLGSLLSILLLGKMFLGFERIALLLLPLVVSAVSIFQEIIMLLSVVLREPSRFPILEIFLSLLVRLVHVPGFSPDLFSLCFLCFSEHAF